MQNWREEQEIKWPGVANFVIFPFLRAKAALNLETQIENTDKIVSTFEAKLAQDSIIPASPNALQDRANDLQVREHQTLC